MVPFAMPVDGPDDRGPGTSDQRAVALAVGRVLMTMADFELPLDARVPVGFVLADLLAQEGIPLPPVLRAFVEVSGRTRVSLTERSESLFDESGDRVTLVDVRHCGPRFGV